MGVDMLPRETQAIRVARALGDPTRFRILRAIAARAEISCHALAARFPIAQATVSHHLKVLAGAGLVTVRKEGPFHFYRVLPGALRDHGRILAEAFGGRRAARPRGRKAVTTAARKESLT